MRVLRHGFCGPAVVAISGAIVATAPTMLAAGGTGTVSGPDWGPEPALTAPRTSWLPTVKVAPAIGWKDAGDRPAAARGLTVTPFARALDHPRWLLVLPNGDVLVAETNKPEGTGLGGVRGFVMGLVMGKAGAGVASANRITLLRDADGDGVAEVKSQFLSGLNSPFGMALSGSTLYVANTDAVVAYTYVAGEMAVTSPGRKIADLPAGTLNHHWTKNIAVSRDGQKLFATVGSNSNIGENGLDVELDRAAILEIDIATGTRRVFASGLRNPNGLDFEPETGALWTVVNERDELGDTIVPDYLTSVADGGFYGWPYSYFGANVDARVMPQDEKLVASAIKPDYAVGAHTATLGLAFSRAGVLSEAYRAGAFLGQHGSWNRTEPSGYQVVFIPFAAGQPSGGARAVLTGFLDTEGRAKGRPVGVALDGRGGLLVADDVGNTIWRVTAAGTLAP